MKALITDFDFPDIALERRHLCARPASTLAEAQCRTEDQLIAAARDCDALLLQYAPVTERVLARCRRVGIVSRYGAGFDTVDTAACARHGVWVANSPDYGVGEVATHALAMTLALAAASGDLRPRCARPDAGVTLSPGTIRRASDLTVGILGLGRIGKRYAHLARNCFARVIACDPYIIDGDFPAYVERVDARRAVRAERHRLAACAAERRDARHGATRAAGAHAPRQHAGQHGARRAWSTSTPCWRALDDGTLDGAALDVLPIEPIATEPSAGAPPARAADAARGVLFDARRKSNCDARRQ